MMKSGGRCTVQKSRPSSNFGVRALGVHPNVAFGYDVGKISACCLVYVYSRHQRSVPVTYSVGNTVGRRLNPFISTFFSDCGKNESTKAFSAILV